MVIDEGPRLEPRKPEPSGEAGASQTGRKFWARREECWAPVPGAILVCPACDRGNFPLQGRP